MTTQDKILAATRDLLAEGGIGAVSFDAVARQLGLSKQAVLYWFPSKQGLLAELFIGWLSAETDVAVAALAGDEGRADPVAAFVKALAGFHLGNLDQFRMMYLVPQTLRSGAAEAMGPEMMARVHVVTGRLYGALADRLPGDPGTARQEAVAIHTAVLGLVLLHGLADATGDPLKHSSDDLVAALISRLRRKGA